MVLQKLRQWEGTASARRGPRRRGRGRGALLLLLIALVACVQAGEERPDRGWSFSVDGQRVAQPASPTRGAEHAAGPREFPSLGAQDTYSAELPGQLPPDVVSPFHRYRWNLIRNPDGSLTKLYYFRTGNPGVQVYIELMNKQVPGFAGLQNGQDYWPKEGFLVDPRKKSDSTWHQGGDTGLPTGPGAVADLLIVTASEEMLQRIDSFLQGTISELPQLEIEVTIIEIAMDDDLSYGMKTQFSRGTESDPEGNFLDGGSVDLAQGLVSGAFGSFSAIQDETVINGLIELFQGTRWSNVLSSPKLAVLNGHRAVIDTGQKVPFFTPNFNANGITSIGTAFKNTGIRCVVVPFILSADTVQLDISVEVSNLSGFITAGVGSGAEIENPLIARRNAYTVVNVPSGKTVLIGGLITNDEVDTVDKVPILGDIPLLGYLFKRKSVERRKAQVLFMVKPKILREGFRDGVLYDPAQDD